MTLDDVIGVDNIAIIVEEMQGANLCQKSWWQEMGFMVITWMSEEEEEADGGDNGNVSTAME